MRILILLFLVLTITRLSFAQTAQAKKMDEFGPIQYGDTASRMDAVAYHLINNPGGKVYIIVYASQSNYFNVDHRYSQRLRNYILKNQYQAHPQISPERVIAVSGGRQTEQHTEIWFVPENAKPPVPSSKFTADQIPANQIIKFDDYRIDFSTDEDFDYWDGRYEDPFARLGRIAEILKQRPDLHLYIIGQSQGVYIYKKISGKDKNGKQKYAQVKDRKLSDKPGTDKKIVNQEKLHLINMFGIESPQITAVGIGYSQPSAGGEFSEQSLFYAGRSIELWLVPKNASKIELDKITRSKLRNLNSFQ